MRMEYVFVVHPPKILECRHQEYETNVDDSCPRVFVSEVVVRSVPKIVEVENNCP
jgi:hypothetical protein